MDLKKRDKICSVLELNQDYLNLSLHMGLLGMKMWLLVIEKIKHVYTQRDM